MAMAGAYKLVEKTQVRPTITHDPRTTTSLPLSFLDLPWTGPIYVRRQFFYHFPYSTHHFCETTLPALKCSLSLTLQHYFPLAGNLLCPPPPHKPFIHCTNDDSVPLTIIESTADFNYISSNHPKNLKDLDHLVPKLTFTALHDDTLSFPLVAFQATVFPNHGLCIAITYCHVMDDRCCSHFMKSWSSICRSGGVDSTVVVKSQPYFDKEVLKDPKGLEAIFLRDYFEERSTWKAKLIRQTQTTECIGGDEDYVKATIIFGKEDIEGLKRWALNCWKKNDEYYVPQYLSKFVVTCGFVWASMVKAKYQNDDQEEMKDEHFHFGFAADCKDRLEYHVPETYFGNCLMICHAEVKRKDLKGEDGFVNAVKAIKMTIANLKNHLFEGAEKWRSTFKKMYVMESTVLVNGSPKFNVYETNFGFGRPTKVEMVHAFKCISLAEGGDMEGGIEVGLVFKSSELEDFISIIEHGLKALKS